jgi:hypothetical protein
MMDGEDGWRDDGRRDDGWRYGGDDGDGGKNKIYVKKKKINNNKNLKK